MKQMMILVKVSEPQTREFTTKNNEVRTIKYRNLLLDDGIDSIYGETSERLTMRIDAQNEEVKLRLIEGHVYNVDYTLKAQPYKTKDNKDSVFMSCTINKLSPIV